MARTWNVLVVDDEQDVHAVTVLALKRRKWKDRPLALTSAMSGEEARAILTAPGAPQFNVALVDVVMETADAGLKLCQFIRANFPPTLRIILRTGQPGAAPEEKVLNTYDIDHYLAKAEMTEGRLYGAIRACLRMSQDIGGVLAMASQLRTLTAELKDPLATATSLAATMRKTLGFFEDKYAAKLTFIPNVKDAPRELSTTEKAAGDVDDGRRAIEALQKAVASGLPAMKLHAGESLGLPVGDWVVLTSTGKARAPAEKATGVAGWLTKVFGGNVGSNEQEGTVVAGLVVRFEDASSSAHDDFLLDLELFMTNWVLVEEVFVLRHKPAAPILVV
jgi:CheY-like chemotaxis protein